MQRHRVLGRPDGWQAPDYERHLVERAAQSVLEGGLCGAEILRLPEGVRACELSGREPNLQQWMETAARARAAASSAAFPVVVEKRESLMVRGRVSAPFAWELLQLEDLQGRPIPCPPDGPFALAWFAPWSIDSQSGWERLCARVRERGVHAALVATYATADEVRAFVGDRPPAAVWISPAEKSERARLQSVHAMLRQLEADPRPWGLPAWRELRVHAGRFVLIME